LTIPELEREGPVRDKKSRAKDWKTNTKVHSQCPAWQHHQKNIVIGRVIRFSHSTGFFGLAWAMNGTVIQLLHRGVLAASKVNSLILNKHKLKQG